MRDLESRGMADKWLEDKHYFTRSFVDSDRVSTHGKVVKLKKLPDTPVRGKMQNVSITQADVATLQKYYIKRDHNGAWLLAWSEWKD